MVFQLKVFEQQWQDASVFYSSLLCYVPKLIFSQILTKYSYISLISDIDIFQSQNIMRRLTYGHKRELYVKSIELKQSYNNECKQSCYLFFSFTSWLCATLSYNAPYHRFGS
jgi:hypothetical protein